MKVVTETTSARIEVTMGSQNESQLGIFVKRKFNAGGELLSACCVISDADSAGALLAS